MTTQREFTGVYKRRGKWVVAWVEEVPGVNTQGRTLKEAKDNLREALSLILAENRRIARRRDNTVTRESFRLAAPA